MSGHHNITNAMMASIASMTLDHHTVSLGNPQPARFEQVVPNFVSKHVRTYCDNLCKQHLAEIAKESYMKPQLLSASPKAVQALPVLKTAVSEAFAVVVMADVSGYSKLTAELAERGPIGAELLSKTMKGYLDKIIQIVLLYGGDIVKFAGDAVIIYWKIDGPFDTGSPVTDAVSIARGELVVKACRCCMELLEKLGVYHIGIPDCQMESLRIHLGIGAGQTFDVHVGGDGRWEHFIAGDGISQLGHVLDLAKAGELAMSHEAVKWFQAVMDIDTADIGNYDKRCVIVKGIDQARRKVPPSSPPAMDEIELWDIASADLNVELYKKFINNPALFKLEADINQSRLFRLESALSDLLSLCELRQVTTVFIKIGSLGQWDPENSPNLAQQAISIVQSALLKYEGSLRQFHIDDKGAVMLMFFGLPPLAHENDASVGLKAGLQIWQEYDKIFDEFSIGVTTGVVSIGGVGNAVRTEYAVMGDSINMAARIMCHSEAACSILCDERTYNLCEREFSFQILGEVVVKGKKHPISIFRPVEIKETTNTSNRSQDEKFEIIGRIKEKEAIRKAIESAPRTEPAVVILEGEGGQGLSTLVALSKREGAALNHHVCSGSATEMERYTPYFIFRHVVLGLFAAIDSHHNVNQKEKVLPENPAIPIISIEENSLTVKHNIIISKSNENLDPDSVNICSSNNLNPNNLPRRSVFDDSTLPKRSLSHTLLVGAPLGGLTPPEIIKSQEIYYEETFRSGLEKLREDPSLAQLFSQIVPFNTDFEIQAEAMMRMKDLSELLQLVINKISETKPILITFHEAQWADAMSWDLLWEIFNGCPKVAIFIFSRPERFYENSETISGYIKFKRLPRANSFSVQGLSMNETITMVMNCWTGSSLKSVSKIIVDNIHKRTLGNPLFISSLTTALKESGQWRVDHMGELTTQSADFDFEQVVLGGDLQSIITAQFDRLDRNFQLFLKVAAAFGQRFQVDDVFHFVSDMPRFNEAFDRRSPLHTSKKIELLDKYTFLTKAETDSTEGLSFSFKSAVVRKCIYLMMLLGQRQQLHLNIALYYEKLHNDTNRPNLLIPIYQHFAETGDKQKLKKLRYLEAVSHFYYEKHLMADAIKYYGLLLQTVVEMQKETGLLLFNRVTVAKWHRELGEAHYARAEWEESEKCLLESLKLVEHEFPQSNWKLKSKIWLAMVQREKHFRNNKGDKFPTTSSTDANWGSKSNHGRGKVSASRSSLTQKKGWKGAEGNAFSGNSQMNVGVFQNTGAAQANSGMLFGKAPANTEAEALLSVTATNRKLSVLHSIRLALVTLSQLYLQTNKLQHHKYAVLTGLNISEDFPKDSLYGQFLAQVGAIFWMPDEKRKLSLLYLEAADRHDQYSSIAYTCKISSATASSLFLMGYLDPSIRRYETLHELSLISGDFNVREEAARMGAIVLFHKGPHSRSASAAKELYSVSSQKDHWYGKFWGSLLTIPAITTGKYTNEILNEVAKSFYSVFDQAHDESKSNVIIQVNRLAMMTKLDVLLKPDQIPLSFYLEMTELVNQVSVQHWAALNGFIHAANALYSAHDMQKINKSHLVALKKLCDAVNKAISRTKCCYYSEILRRVWSALHHYAANRKRNAIAEWKRGASVGNGTTEYLIGQLHWRIGQTSENAEEAEKHKILAKEIFEELGAFNP